MMVILTAAGRPRAADEAEAAALFRGMTACTGRYRVEGARIVFAVDVACDPALEGTEVARFLDLDGDDLTLTTGVEQHRLYPGRGFRASVGPGASRTLGRGGFAHVPAAARPHRSAAPAARAPHGARLLRRMRPQCRARCPFAKGDGAGARG